MNKANDNVSEQLKAEVRRANEAIVDMKLAIAESDEARRHVNGLRKEIVTLTHLLAESQQEREILRDQLKSLQGAKS